MLMENPVIFNHIATRRHLNLNLCLKEAFTGTGKVPATKRRKRRNQKRFFSNLNLSYLPHHDRVLVTAAVKANGLSRLHKKKKAAWQKGVVV